MPWSGSRSISEVLVIRAMNECLKWVFLLRGVCGGGGVLHRAYGTLGTAPEQTTPEVC